MSAESEILKFRDIYYRDDVTEYECCFQISGSTVMITQMPETSLYDMAEAIAYHICNQYKVDPHKMKWIEKRYDQKMNASYQWVQFDGVEWDLEEQDWWFYKSPYTRRQKLRKKTVDKWMAINNPFILK